MNEAVAEDVLKLADKYSNLTFFVLAYNSDETHFEIYCTGCGRCAVERISQWASITNPKHDDEGEEIRH